jgi:PAS domain S-box-containing protein
MSDIKVLYIEDDDSQRIQLADQMKSRGFQVAAVGSGVAGLLHLEKNHADVLLCDLHMPSMGGLDVLRWVRDFLPSIPVILLTAHGSVELAVQAMQIGAYDFMIKPLAIEQVEATIRNALERASLVKKLQRSESNLEMILDNVPDIIYSLSPEGEFISINQAAERILGYKLEDMLGNSVFNYIHPDDCERIRTAFDTAIRTGKQSAPTIEFRMITQSGEVRHFEVSGRPIFEFGNIVRHDGIVRDITQRKEMQQKLREYSQQLERMVKERTERLEFATHQLAALNEASNRFTQIFDEKTLLDEVPTLLTRTLDFDRGYVILEADGRMTLRAFSMERDSPELIENFLQRVNDPNFPPPPPFIESFQQNKTIFIADPNKDPRWPKKEGEIIRTKAVVSSPIRVGGKPIGLLTANMQHHVREMDQDDVTRFEMFANMVGLALENIRAFQSLERKVIERTKELRDANREMREKTDKLEKATYSLANANVQLLAVQEQLENRNSELELVLNELTESKRRMEAILDSSSTGILVVDHAGQVIAANPSVERFFGVTVSEILGKPIGVFADLIRECFQNAEDYERHKKEILMSPDVFLEADLVEIFENGLELIKPSSRIIAAIPTPVTDREKHVFGRVWGYTDITELKKADEQIHKIVNASPVAVFMHRVEDGRILYVNENFSNLMGKSIEELEKTSIQDIFEDLEERREVLHALKKEGYIKNQEYPLSRPDGTNMWVLASAQMTEIGGESVVIAGLSDITVRKKAEEAVIEANKHLRETQSQLVQSEKMAALGVLVAGVAHEINTPIAAINSMHDTQVRAMEKFMSFVKTQLPDILENQKMKTTMEIINEADRVIESGCDRVTNIVKRLRSFARLDEAELKTADIHEGLEDTLTLIHHELKHGIKVKKNYGDIPQIACFPGRLNQVFLNLLVNAKQAMKGCGEIEISTTYSDGKVYVAISDNGVGIPPENLKRIFDPGFTTKGVGVGTGLGLSICYQIIQDHHGEIQVTSEVGKGSTFTVILPTNLPALKSKKSKAFATPAS